MSDTFTNPFKSFFFANDPNISSDMRKRIALQMMMSKSKAYPKTFGEGLGAIGDALGDIGAARQLGAIDAAENVAGDALLKKYSSPQAEAEPNQKTAYAPAAPPPAAPSIVPAQPPRAAPVAAPSGGAAPVAAGPGGVVEPGDYNEIDAADPRNRYRPAPAYLQGALERNIEDPERRAYLGQLAGKEAQSAGEVSPTGAAGPFQFTRGTGAQYGIPGNARFDPDASTLAANAFTDDNVKALTARLGREPTPSELALAHQQGAGTAANMLTGTGNASARNLAVNNVPPGTAPAAAAQRVMNYYGMPAPMGGDPRTRVAATLAAQQAPVVAQDDAAAPDQQLALAAPQPPAPDLGIRPAPPAAPIRQAPLPQQVAQAQATNPLIPPLPPEPIPPPTMTPLQQRILQDINAEPPFTREAAKKKLQPIWDQEEAKIKQAHEVYKDKLAARRAMETEQYKLTAGAPKTAAEIEKIQQEVVEAKNNELRAQFANMDPETVFKTMTESSKVASSAAKSLAASQSAITALNAGAITGAGAEARLDIAKFLHNMGLPDKGNVIANTETFRGAMQPVVASIMHQTSGTSQLSEGELKFAANAAAGNITLDAQSIRQLTTIIDKASRGIIADHQKKMDVLFPDNPQAKALFGVEPPKPSAPSAGTPDGTTATGPNGAKMIRRNGRWEPM